MTVFEIAMNMEKEGEQFYRDLAAKCANPGLKRILGMLADDEKGHYLAFQKMQTGETPSLSETSALKNAKSIFQEMREKNEPINLQDSPLDLYKKAVDLENRSEAFYREQAGIVPGDINRKSLLLLASEERKHATLLTNLIDFLGRPATWLENAEFNHLEEY